MFFFTGLNEERGWYLRILTLDIDMGTLGYVGRIFLDFAVK